MFNPNPTYSSSAPVTEPLSSTGPWYYNWKIWVIIIIILAILGFNVFTYLAKGTQTLSNVLGPITGNLGTLLGQTTTQIVNTSATGAKAGVDIAAGTVTSGIDTIQLVSSSSKLPEGSGSTSSLTSQPVSTTQSQPQVNSLSNALNNASTNMDTSSSSISGGYQADESSSTIQSANSTGKVGWCYIGEDNGHRACAQVGANDMCMSGDIFPTSEICINPSLRQ